MENFDLDQEIELINSILGGELSSSDKEVLRDTAESIGYYYYEEVDKNLTEAEIRDIASEQCQEYYTDVEDELLGLLIESWQYGYNLAKEEGM